MNFRGSYINSIPTTPIPGMENVELPRFGDVGGSEQSTASSYLLQRPFIKLPPFSGATKPNAGEADYETWRSTLLRVTGDDPGYPLPQVRASLREDALQVAEGCTSIQGILDALDEFFLEDGNKKKVMEEYYGAQQRKGEGASQFLIRLMGLRKKISALDPTGALEQVEADMREVFWKGLMDDNIKASLHFKYSTGCPTTELMREVRKQEAERGTTKKPVQAQVHKFQNKPSSQPEQSPAAAKAAAAAPVHDSHKEISSLREEMKELKDALAKLTAVGAQPRQHVQGDATRNVRRPRQPPICYRCGQVGHMQRDCEAAPNADLVQRRLMERSSSNGVGRQRRGAATPMPNHQ